ncbi:MAG: C-terminal target protein [Chitinophagaceae bacterium]|nr:C-terminal target protein [Chitinophagaceae bacterium]
MHHFLKLFALVCIFILLNVQSAFAMNTWVWTGAINANWNNAGNWQMNGGTAVTYPTNSADIVTMTPATLTTTLVSGATGFSSLTISNVNLSTNVAFTVGTFNVTNASLNSSAAFTATTLTASSFSLTITGNFSVTGTLTLSGTNSITTSNGSTFTVGTLNTSGTTSVTSSSAITAGTMTASNFTLNVTANYKVTGACTLSSGNSFNTTNGSTFTLSTTTAAVSLANTNFNALPFYITNYTATTVLEINTCQFYSAFTVSINNFNIHGCTFGNAGSTYPISITKPVSGGTDVALIDSYNCGNTYYGPVTMTNSSNTYAYWGNGDSFYSDVTFNRNNQYDLYVGSSSTCPSVNFYGNAYFNSNNTSNPTGSLYLARNSGNHAYFNPTGNTSVAVLFNNASVGTIDVASAGTVDFMSRSGSTNVITIELRNTNTTYVAVPAVGSILFGNSGGTAHFGNRVVSFTMTSFIIGTASFANSTFDTNVNLNIPVVVTNSTILQLKPGVVFSDGLIFYFKNIQITGGTYTSVTHPLTFTKYGTNGDANCVDNTATGTVTINGNVTIANASYNKFYFGSNSGDVFNYNGNVTLQQNTTSPTNEVLTSTGGTSNYTGNYLYQGNALLLAMAGKSNFIGTTDQTIGTNSISNNNVWFGFLQVNKPSGKLILQSPVSVGGVTSSDLTLTQGNIVTTSSLLLTVLDKATTTGGSYLSFVEGPLKKVGCVDNTCSTPYYTYYVGKPGVYMPARITAMATGTTALTVEFFNQSITLTGATTFSGLRDGQLCQYWSFASSGTGTPAVRISLSWNNTAGQTCYPVNSSVLSIANITNGGGANTWSNLASTVDGTSVISGFGTIPPGTSYGTVTATGVTSTFGTFALGYLNALVIDTRLTNLTTFKITSGIEPFADPTFYSSNGPTASAPSTKTALNNMYANIFGMIVVHPTLGTTMNVAVQTDARTDALSMNVIMEASAATSPNVNKVQAQEDGVYNDMSTEFYSRSGNTLTFYKDKQDPAYYTSLTNNLTDGITFYASRFSPNLNTYFQITGIPTGFTAVLSIKNSANTPIYTNTTDLKWDGTTQPSPKLYAAEGIYQYQLQLNCTSPSQVYILNGQFSLKYK